MLLELYSLVQTYHPHAAALSYHCMSYIGDTLFVGSCGKFFEGTGKQMYTALYDVLAKLRQETVSKLSSMITDMLHEFVYRKCTVVMSMG